MSHPRAKQAKPLSMTPSAIRSRARRVRQAAPNGGINPATKLPHTATWLAAR